jgi:hypothetical protein
MILALKNKSPKDPWHFLRDQKLDKMIEDFHSLGNGYKNIYSAQISQ